MGTPPPGVKTENITFPILRMRAVINPLRKGHSLFVRITEYPPPIEALRVHSHWGITKAKAKDFLDFTVKVSMLLASITKNGYSNQI